MRSTNQSDKVQREYVFLAMKVLAGVVFFGELLWQGVGQYAGR